MSKTNNQTISINERLKKFVDSYDRFFIDTCSLMDDCAELFFSNISPFLKAANKQIIVPTVVYKKELRVCAAQTEDKEKKARANRAITLIESLKSSGVIQFFGDQSDLKDIADNIFLAVITRFRRTYNMALITQDNGLNADIERLKDDVSVTRGLKRVDVWRLKKDGVPGKFLGTNTKKNAASPKGQATEGVATTISERIPRKHKKQEPEDIEDEDVDAFRSCTQVTTSENKVLNYALNVTEGSTVTAVAGMKKKQVRLVERLSEGGEGTIYETDTPYVAKIYKQGKLTSHKFEKLRLMLKHNVACAGVCFPIALLYDKQNTFVGYLMEKAKGYTLQGSLFLPPLLKKRFPQWKKLDCVQLSLTILKKIQYLHKRNIILGDINPQNIMVCSPTEVYFVDTDSYQIEEYPCPVGTTIFTAPEIQRKDFEKFLRTEGSERFAIATLLFMIMLPGKAPYAQLGGEDQVKNILRMDFSYPLAENSNGKTPEGPWRFVWSHLTYALKEAFYQTFKKDEAHATESTRLSDEEWISLFEEYERILKKGTKDPMSAELFPYRFKNISGNNIEITCRLCKREMPEATSRNGICQNCLRISETLVCSRCQKDFRYSNYEKYILNRPQSEICLDCHKWLRQIAKQIECVDCGKIFNLTNRDAEFYNKQDLVLPKRCKNCRKAKKERSSSFTPSSGGYSSRGSSQSSSSSGSFCFLTTAVCEFAGKADDCEELSALRSYRDNWLAHEPRGQQIIKDYYDRAPRLVQMLKQSPWYEDLCQWLLVQFISPCVSYIRNNHYNKCLETYIEMVETLEKKLLSSFQPTNNNPTKSI